jgi:hypothetical protein
VIAELQRLGGQAVLLVGEKADRGAAVPGSHVEEAAAKAFTTAVER